MVLNIIKKIKNLKALFAFFKKSLLSSPLFPRESLADTPNFPHFSTSPFIKLEPDCPLSQEHRKSSTKLNILSFPFPFPPTPNRLM
jgi:hypothetical protein